MSGKLPKNYMVAKENYEKFCNLPGSLHIATIGSQFNLLNLIDQYKPKSLLDFGAGIGTMSNLVLNYDHISLIIVEKNEFCETQLKINLPIDHVLIHKKIPKCRFDFVIIDDTIKFTEIFRILNFAGDKLVVFIEGRRSSTISKLSLCAMLFSFNGSYNHPNNDSILVKFQFNEKSGSWFILNRGSVFKAILSYSKKFGQTNQIREFYFFLLKKFKVVKMK